MTTSKTMTLRLDTDTIVSGHIYHHTGTSQSQPAAMVILLHGWGADGADLAPLAPMLCSPERQMIIFTPDAPDRCDLNPFGRQWFSLTDPDSYDIAALDSDLISQRCREHLGIIDNMIAALCAEFNQLDTQLYIGGFSQGGMMALAGGLMSRFDVRGIFCLSGGLLIDIPSQPDFKGQILLVHGTDDPIVPLHMMHKADAQLKTCKIDVSAHHIAGMGHSIDQPVLNLLRTFLMS